MVRVLTWNKPRTPTEKELREELIKQGHKPFLSVMERNENSGVQENPHSEIKVLVEGKVEFCAGGRAYTLKPGDRIELPSNTSHVAKNLHTGQSVLLCAKKGKQVQIEIY